MAEKFITMTVKNEEGTADTLYPKTKVEQVIENEEKKFLTTAKETIYDQNTKYTNETPIVSPIGSIEVGETFDNVPVKDMLTKILYPYVKPNVTATCNVGSKTAEKGETITITTITANVTKKSNAIQKVEAYNGSSLIEAKTDGVENGGAIVFNTNQSVTDNTTFSVKVNDGKSTVTANGSSFTFVYPFYWGVVETAAELNSELIVALTKDVSGKSTKSYKTTTNNNSAIIAYPASYGNLKSILDPNGFENLGAFTKSTIEVTGLDSTPQSYNVYRKTEPSTVVDFTWKFIF